LIKLKDRKTPDYSPLTTQITAKGCYLHDSILISDVRREI